MAPEQDAQVVETDDLQEDEPQPQVMALSSPTPMLAAAATTLTTKDLENVRDYVWRQGANISGLFDGDTNFFRWFIWDDITRKDGSKQRTLLGTVKDVKTVATQAKTAAENATSQATNAYDKTQQLSTKLDTTNKLITAVDQQTQTNATKLNELKQSVSDLQTAGGTVELSDEQYDALQQSLATNLLALTISLGVLALILGAIVGIAITMHWRTGRG